MAVAKLGNFEPFTAKQVSTYRLICLHGENESLARERAAALRVAFAAATPAGKPPPAILDIDGDALAREPFLLADDIGAMSLFADRRVLRVSLGARSAEEAFANALPALPDAEGVLVVVDAGTDKRQDPTIRLLSGDRNCLVVACPPDRPDELAAYARRVLAEGGIALDKDSATELVALTDGDRAMLVNELAKLLLLAHGTDALATADMRAAVADEAGTLLDIAADDVLAGDVPATFAAIDGIAAAGGDPVQLAGAALRKALWRHQGASGGKARDMRRAIARLNDVILADRSSDKLAAVRAEMTLIRTAQFFRR